MRFLCRKPAHQAPLSLKQISSCPFRWLVSSGSFLRSPLTSSTNATKKQRIDFQLEWFRIILTAWTCNRKKVGGDFRCDLEDYASCTWNTFRTGKYWGLHYNPDLMQHCTSPRWSHSLFGGWCWESWTSGQNLKSYTMLSYFIYIGLRGPSLNLHCQSNLLCNCLISTMSRTLGFSIEMYLLNKTSCRHVVAIQLPRVFENHCSPGAACVWSPAGYPTPQSPPGRRRTPRSLVHVWSARHVYASCNWNGILYRIPACQQQRWSQRAVTTPAVHPRFFCQARSTKPPFLAPDLCGGIYIYIWIILYV